MPVKAKNNSLSYNKKANCNKVQLILNIIFFASIIYLLYAFAKPQNKSSQASASKIKNWVEENPSVIFDSIIAMQQKQHIKKTQNDKKSIISKKAELSEDKTDPVHNPKGANITVIEFFDYNCGYCKKAGKTVKSLLEKDKKIKFVYKEFPILGKASEDLAKVALAVNILYPKKYKKFHDAIMISNIRTKNDAIAKAKKLGINTKKLKKILKIKAKEIEIKISKNRRLANSLGITGTPAFIVGGELVPGAISLKDLQKLVAQERKK
jgi:protein-disulfide isomerase